MGLLYIVAGIMHFLKTKSYMRVMPRYLPRPKLLVYISGVAELVLGITVMLPATKNYAIIGITLMLLAFLLVHINMLRSRKAGLNLPVWLLVFRLLLQFVLIWWALFYLRF